MSRAKEILEQYERCSFAWKHQNTNRFLGRDFVIQGYIAALSFALDKLGIEHEPADKVLGLKPRPGQAAVAKEVRILFGLEEGDEA
jgi:hypothetical protein